MISVPRLLFQPHQHQPGGGKHEERQHEQQQAKQDQAGLMQPVALGEFGSDRRRDRGARREDRGLDLERIADDEGHRHGLAERAEAPHAVDDRGNAGEQFDREANGAAQPDRADFGEEYRDPEANRNGYHHRDHGGDQRAVDRPERTQHRRIGRRRPALRPQEGRAIFTDRGPGTDDQRDNDAAEDEENRDRAGARDPVEGDVAELERAESPRAIIRSGSIHYVAFDRHLCHANPLYYSPMTRTSVHGFFGSRIVLATPRRERGCPTRGTGLDLLLQSAYRLSS